MKKLLLPLMFSILLGNVDAQLKLYSTNNAGIGLADGVNPLTKLHVNGSVYLPNGQSYWINSTSDAGTHLRMHSTTSAQYIDFYPILNFRTGNGTNMTTSPLMLTPTGIGINNTNPSCALDVTGVAKVNGQLVLTSDQRLKENISNMSGSLMQLARLQGVSYRLKIPVAVEKASTKSAVTQGTTETTDTATVAQYSPVIDTALYNRNHIGFLAQDVQKVFPELVYEDKNGMLSVDYISLIPVLAESIKELNINVETLKTEKINQEKKNAELQVKVTEQKVKYQQLLNEIAELRALIKK